MQALPKAFLLPKTYGPLGSLWHGSLYPALWLPAGWHERRFKFSTHILSSIRDPSKLWSFKSYGVKIKVLCCVLIRGDLPTGQVSHQAGTYLSFCSMKRLGVFPNFPFPPVDGMLIHRKVTSSIKFASTNSPLDPETRALIMRPLCLLLFFTERAAINEVVHAPFSRASDKIPVLAELHPRAKRARGQSPIAKEMW